MNGAEFYEDREQTLVKHEILKHYLQRFALIVGSKWDAISYVDCFAGPWNAKSQELSDSSFSIALSQLRTAKEKLAERGRQIQLRCFFLEKSRKPFLQLKEFAESISDATVETKNAAFEDSIDEIIQFINKGGKKSFSFIFIDPTGWNGIAIETISPLLKLRPGEVLINFMTDFISRFINSPQELTQASFTRLFGSEDAKSRVQAADREEREDAAVAEYCRGLKSAGGFKYTCAAFVLHPLKNSTYYHLVYATRDAKGVEVFKETERKAMQVMERARATAGDRHTEKRTKQKPLSFGEDEIPESRHYDSLRSRYLARAKSAVQTTLQSHRKILYDTAWEMALGLPLVWESDVKEWIESWRPSGHLKIEGLEQRARVPQRNKNHNLVWLL